MSTFIQKDKPEAKFLTVLNDEASSSIALGNPVALKLDATDDGMAVVLPVTATATKAPVLNYGVATEAIAAGARGRVQIFGFCRNAVIVRATRAATSDAWASTAAGAVGDVLKIQTADNAFVRASIPASYSTGTAATDTLAIDLKMFLPFAVLAETLASATTVADSAGPVATVSTSTAKVFLRML